MQVLFAGHMAITDNHCHVTRRGLMCGSSKYVVKLVSF